MSTAQFTRAKLVPFDAGGQTPQDGEAIPLDFNPETLTLKVSSGEQRDSGRRGRQQTQNVGASKATLSFECIFDSTRPRDGVGTGAGGEEMLDVRTRTKPIADLLQVQGDGRDQAPRRVQFRWGTLIFNGVISQHQEVFDYFSPSGVPLRSKVQLTLTEQEFRYEVTATDAARRRAAVDKANTGARAAARAAGAASLLGSGAGGGLGLDLDLDLSVGFDLDIGIDLDLDVGLAADLGLSVKLGASADIGLSVGAGVGLDVDAAVDLFGAGAIAGSAVGGGTAGVGAGVAITTAAGPDLGKAGLDLPRTAAGASAASQSPGPWAPEGPAPGSSAAGLAAVVAAQRAGGAVSASLLPSGPTAAAPLPVRGSPPTSPRRALARPIPLFGAGRAPLAVSGERRPRWETLPPGIAVDAGHGPGCGCRACHGAKGA